MSHGESEWGLVSDWRAEDECSCRQPWTSDGVGILAATGVVQLPVRLPLKHATATLGTRHVAYAVTRATRLQLLSTATPRRVLLADPGASGFNMDARSPA